MFCYVTCYIWRWCMDITILKLFFFTKIQNKIYSLFHWWMATTKTTINDWTEQHKDILSLIVLITCCCVSRLNCNWWCCMLRVAPVSVFISLFVSDIWLKSWHSVRLHSWHGCDYCHWGNDIGWDFHGECYSWWMSLKLAFFALCVVKSSRGAWIKIMVFPLQIH